jgi:cysteinyl-tRNA synthetase
MNIRIYNTLTRRKEILSPVKEGEVSMYVCGPTVYKPSHVGHMVGPVIFDTVKRFLVYAGYKVKFVINITDIDDKLISEASKRKMSVSELASEVTADYKSCLAKLEVTGVDFFPKATDHIAEIIDMISGLIVKGFAYPSEGNVYFDISKDSDYGKLCNRDPEQLEAGARIEVSAFKKNPGDFALWKKSKEGEPKWQSPWGDGRPGWHIECSAMSMKHLGETIDIHGGGLDLQFPHHENELAQTESFTGKPFVRQWMHNGLMKTGDKKMSKSEGNEIVVSSLLNKYKPDCLRYLLLASHYRSPIEFSDDRLSEIKKTLETFFRFFDRYQRITNQSFFTLVPKVSDFSANETLSILKEKFFGFLADDFNTGAAIGVLHELIGFLNRVVELEKLETTRSQIAMNLFYLGTDLLRIFSHILGLFVHPVNSNKSDDIDARLVDLLLNLRNDARETKNFPLADKIRKRLHEIGIILEDRAGATGWYRE